MTPDVAGAPYRGVPAMVLGATGFIGRWVTHALAQQGADLVVVGRDKAATESIMRDLGVDGSVVTADLTRAALVREILHAHRPAIVFNMVGYGVDTSERDASLSATLNADLPALLAETMAGLRGAPWTGQHVVHAGSALEYGTAPGDLAESTRCTPTTLYGQTKLAGTTRLHDLARSNAVRAVTARLFTVYGPGEHDGRLLPSILAGVRAASPIRLSAGLQQRDFTFVDDVVNGMLRLGALSHEDSGIVNVATGVLTTVREFVEIAALEASIAPERLEFGALPTRAEEMHHDPVNVERLRSLTGWVPATPIADGVRITLGRR